MLKKIIRKNILLYEAISGLNLSQENLNEILKGYLESAIWTEEERLNGEYGDSVGYNDDDYEDEDDERDEIEKLIMMQKKFNSTPIEAFVTNDIEPDSKIQAYLDIKTFLKNAGPVAIQEAIENQGLFRLGMDIWLSRNRHGSGFFDHSYENEEILMNAAHQLREVDLYITDDMKLAFSNA